MSFINKLICRCATPMPESAKEKISMFSHVNKQQVICLPDVNNILKVPVVLDDHKLADFFVERLSLKDILETSHSSIGNELIVKNSYMQKWRDLSEK